MASLYLIGLLLAWIMYLRQVDLRCLEDKVRECIPLQPLLRQARPELLPKNTARYWYVYGFSNSN